MLLAATEAVLSGRCSLAALVLQGIGPCARRYSKDQVCPNLTHSCPCLVTTAAGQAWGSLPHLSTLRAPCRALQSSTSFLLGGQAGYGEGEAAAGGDG